MRKVKVIRNSIVKNSKTESGCIFPSASSLAFLFFIKCKWKLSRSCRFAFTWYGTRRRVVIVIAAARDWIIKQFKVFQLKTPCVYSATMISIFPNVDRWRIVCHGRGSWAAGKRNLTISPVGFSYPLNFPSSSQFWRCTPSFEKILMLVISLLHSCPTTAETAAGYQIKIKSLAWIKTFSKFSQFR